MILPTSSIEADIPTNRTDILQWLEKKATWLSLEAPTSFITNVGKLIEGKKERQICSIQ